MNLDRLYRILRETTAQFRKGEEIEGDPQLVDAVKNFKEGDNIDRLPGGSVHIYAMPHESQAKDGIEKVDLHFIVVGVDRAKAEQYKDELVAILKTYPQPERLAGGPSYIASYIEVGGEIGDQGRGVPTVRTREGSRSLGCHHAGEARHHRPRGESDGGHGFRDDKRFQSRLTHEQSVPFVSS